jgi:hypothetical protein
MRVLIGTPVHRNGAFALERYLANQQQIQRECPGCQLCLATDDAGFAAELEEALRHLKLRAEVIQFSTEKPDYARSRIWDIAGGRESIRRYFLSRPDRDGLLFLDADMTYDPRVVAIMEKELAGCDALFSGYRLRDNRIGLAGAGCLLVTRRAMQDIRFRCYEFRNRQEIPEDTVLEMDLFRRGRRIKKGFFLAIDHFFSPTEARSINPQRVSLFRGLTTHSLFRFCLIRTSVALHFNLPAKGYRIRGALERWAGRFRKARSTDLPE